MVRLVSQASSTPPPAICPEYGPRLTNERMTGGGARIAPTVRTVTETLVRTKPTPSLLVRGHS